MYRKMELRAKNKEGEAMSSSQQVEAIVRRRNNHHHQEEEMYSPVLNRFPLTVIAFSLKSRSNPMCVRSGLKLKKEYGRKNMEERIW